MAEEDGEMLEHSTRAWGSPSRYIQGRVELNNIREYTEICGRRVFFLINVFFFKSLKEKFGASELFGVEKDASFHSSIGQIYQTWEGRDLYPSIEEKAAMLLLQKHVTFSRYLVLQTETQALFL